MSHIYFSDFLWGLFLGLFASNYTSRALREADRIANATPFIEFLLQAILDTPIEIEGDQIPIERINPHIQLFLDKLGNDELSAGEIMKQMGLKNRPAFRKTYLQPALNSQLIEMTLPDKPNSKNQKYRKRKPEQS